MNWRTHFLLIPDQTEDDKTAFQRDSLTPHGQLNASLCVNEITHMHHSLHLENPSYNNV